MEADSVENHRLLIYAVDSSLKLHERTANFLRGHYLLVTVETFLQHQGLCHSCLFFCSEINIYNE